MNFDVLEAFGAESRGRKEERIDRVVTWMAAILAVECLVKMNLGMIRLSLSPNELYILNSLSLAENT